jgi:hypothetical protein
MDRKFPPNTAIAIPVEDFFGNEFEQWMRGREINKRVALIVGYEFSAALDELRAIVVEEWA